MEKFLEGKTLWKELEKASKSASSKRYGAIGYFSVDFVGFELGDTLIVDTSDDAIRTGQTSAKTLRSALDAGLRLWSYDGLHAKVVIIDDLLFVSSANSSESSRSGKLQEAGYVTDSSSGWAQARSFISRLSRSQGACRIDEEFIRRISKIPVVCRMSIARKSPVPVTRRKNGGHVWFVRCFQRTRKDPDNVQRQVDAGARVALKRFARPVDEPEILYWRSDSQLGTDCRRDDRLLLFNRDKGRVSLEHFALVRHVRRIEGANLTCIYYEFTLAPE